MFCSGKWYLMNYLHWGEDYAGDQLCCWNECFHMQIASYNRAERLIYGGGESESTTNTNTNTKTNQDTNWNINQNTNTNTNKERVCCNQMSF